MYVANNGVVQSYIATMIQPNTGHHNNQLTWPCPRVGSVVTSTPAVAGQAPVVTSTPVDVSYLLLFSFW